MRKLQDDSNFIEGVENVYTYYNNGVKIIVIIDKKGDKISITEKELSMVNDFLQYEPIGKENFPFAWIKNG